MNTTSSNSNPPTKPGRFRSYRARIAQIAVAGGLVAGASFAATGISSATSTSPTTTGSTTSGSRSTAVAPLGPRGLRGGPRGPKGGPGGRGRGPNGGPGGHKGKGGTITAINGSTLSLRTENGTERVDTSSSTTYSKEMQTISFSGLHVNDIVHVAGTPTTSTSTATPPQPGTGTVNATAVTVVLPSFAGRVTSSSNGTYSLVGHDGQLLTVKTTGSTRYYNGTSRASASAISAGTHVMAEGAQNGLTDLTADVIAVMPTPPTPPAGAPAPARSSATTSGLRGSSTTSARSSTTSNSGG